MQVKLSYWSFQAFRPSMCAPSFRTRSKGADGVWTCVHRVGGFRKISLTASLDDQTHQRRRACMVEPWVFSMASPSREYSSFSAATCSCSSAPARARQGQPSRQPEAQRMEHRRQAGVQNSTWSTAA